MADPVAGGEDETMVAMSIELSGTNARGQAEDLRAALMAAEYEVSPVEVDRDAALAVAVINTVLVGTQTLILIWEWWASHHHSGDQNVKITLEDGRVLHFDHGGHGPVAIDLSGGGPSKPDTGITDD